MINQMRPIETLLLLANLLTFFVLTVLLPRTVRWTGYSALIALIIAVVQVLVEGSRWQMIPAYVLTGLFFLVWLWQKIARREAVNRRLFPAFGEAGK